MTHREFVTWRALFKVSPFDDERCFDVPSAQVAHQVNRLRGANAPLSDFIPYRYKPPTEGVPDGIDGGLMTYMHSRSTRN